MESISEEKLMSEMELLVFLLCPKLVSNVLSLALYEKNKTTNE